MSPIKVHKLSADRGPVVGFCLVGHETISRSGPALVGNETEELEVPLKFYTGDLNLIRSELHNLVDEALNALEDGE